ncbi:hypothetical protein HYPSUDRAFT_37484 [Hypholoma sublateritium FD-334 SS-4]|uniref:BUB1 N-terminal domain-containing protein n=1 Tax=Hypholoma sublateritium (strain FD-334 SS-4) TaxID=945553 RepID=A0A0D2MNK0_HYPSF|nr:hypothetical protein HYPSUDRAFT_37484 [Hypholoma sublateritium FD-334 SS-4]
MASAIPEMVDCDVLEAAKENVQPLATGRRVTALSALLATPHAQREAKLTATRNRLRINVSLALDDEADGDPLEAYCALVNWTVENYPQGHSAESGLLELLEEATRTLKDAGGGRWRSELRYLKLWLLYASYVEKPTVIYKFLIANDIGTEYALLYEEHAAVLERDGRRKEADDAYALGIARRAVPLEHLQSRYADFQKRMMSNASRPAAAHETPTPAPAPASRRALATTASSLPASSSRQPAVTPASASANNNARLQIFVDPTGEAGETADGGAWGELGTRKARVKENTPEVRKLVGTTLRQAGRTKRVAGAASGSGAGARIVPFRDPAPGTRPGEGDAGPGSGAPRGEKARTKTNLAKEKEEAPPPAQAPAKAFLPFVDEAPPPGATVPSFTPFRDETEGTPAGTLAPAGEAVMKVKELDKGVDARATAAEALRRDPLKNYGVALTP